MSGPTATTQTSPFFLLPAEVRNIIYGLVLTTTEEVACVPYQSRERTLQRLRILYLPDYSTAADLNQMKFTCRQLYVETSGLLPTCTMRQFPDALGTTDCASIMCASSLSANTSDVLRNLREISIVERAPYRARKFWARIFDPHGISALVDFCRAHPQITVHVWLSSTDLSAWNPPMSLALQITHFIVRKQLSSINHGVFNELVTKGIENIARTCPGLAAYAPASPDNLKIRPVGTFVDVRLNFSFASRGAAGMDEEQTLESWYTNGF